MSKFHICDSEIADKKVIVIIKQLWGYDYKFAKLPNLDYFNEKLFLSEVILKCLTIFILPAVFIKPLNSKCDTCINLWLI